MLTISTAALLRFASAMNNGLRPSRPYWLGRLRNSGLSVASCHRGRELFGYAAGSVPSGRAVRFSAGPQGLFQAAADCRKLPASPARFVLVHRSHWRSHGQADSSASHEVLSPSAPARRAALSTGAARRTIPLRLWLACSAPPKSVSRMVGPASVPLRSFAVHPHGPPSDALMRMWLAAGHASGPFNPAMFRYPLCREPCAAPPELSCSGDAPGVFPFAVLLLHARFWGVSAPLSPHAVR